MNNFLDFLLSILLGKPKYPLIKNLREVKNDNLYFKSLTRGTVVSGNPGMGKTTWTSIEIIDFAKEHEDCSGFILDASGSLTNEIIELAHLEPPEIRDRLTRRFVLDIPGDEHYVVPQPFFSPEYGLNDEELVRRAVNILLELNREQVERTPIMAIALTELAPELFKLINVTRNDYGERWQITETRKLLMDLGLLRMACKHFGQYAKGAKEYIEYEILGEEATKAERQRRMLALRNAMGVIENRSLKARYGAYRPTITPKEIIDNALIYILSGEKLTNLEDAQAWVFWDAYSSLEAVINKRTPHDPRDKHVLLVIDEVYKLFEIKGLAKKLGQISTYYRSRKLMPIIIIQAYWQLADILKEQIWSFGNQVTFALENFNDAYKFAQQVEEYDPVKERLAPKRDDGQPILDTDRGQYLEMTNWLQRLEKRQVVMRRYLDEGKREPFISFIEKTSEKPVGALPSSIHQLKQELLRKYAVSISDVLRDINGRHIQGKQEERPTFD